MTSLDGDVVRRNLSAGLDLLPARTARPTSAGSAGSPPRSRRHGGVAICRPIAPFDATRQQVRAMVEEAGGAFVLVHVATPLEECERRDRKGLYAKARRGEIPEFTGISSPYEEPTDADRDGRHHRSIDRRLLGGRPLGAVCRRVAEGSTRGLRQAARINPSAEELLHLSPRRDRPRWFSDPVDSRGDLHERRLHRSEELEGDRVIPGLDRQADIAGRIRSVMRTVSVPDRKTGRRYFPGRRRTAPQRPSCSDRRSWSGRLSRRSPRRQGTSRDLGKKKTDKLVW